MKKRKLLQKLIAEHFQGIALDQLAVLRARFPHWMRPDLQRGLELALRDADEVHFYGARLRGGRFAFRFSDLLEQGKHGIAVGPPVHDELEIGEAQPLRCLQHGVWLLRRAETYRGKVLAPSEEEYAFDEGPVTLRVLRLRTVERDDIVLAPGLLDRVERNTIGFAARCEELVRLGMTAQKGVLLYGPPGTGKTLLVRYLASALAGYTKFVLSADKLGWLGDTIDAARLLTPAMIVIEDVDLIAAHRDGPWQHTPVTLNRLLKEMDGVGTDARLLFVLTTNRPEVLEPALAARPGRIDQAIEIGLPEDRERRLLLHRCARGLPLADETIAQVSRRAGKVSPAFLKELVRRAAQAMLERAGERLEEADFARAFEDMSGAGAKVTARLLGAEGFGFVTQ